MSGAHLVEKILLIAGLSKELFGNLVLERVIPGAITVAGLVLVTAMMMSAMMIGGLYVAYLSLLLYTDPHMAAFMTFMLAFLLVVILILIIISILKYMRDMPKRILREKAPFTSHIKETVDSFIDGLLSDKP